MPALLLSAMGRRAEDTARVHPCSLFPVPCSLFPNSLLPEYQPRVTVSGIDTGAQEAVDGVRAAVVGEEGEAHVAVVVVQETAEEAEAKSKVRLALE